MRAPGSRSSRAHAVSNRASPASVGAARVRGAGDGAEGLVAVLERDRRALETVLAQAARHAVAQVQQRAPELGAVGGVHGRRCAPGPRSWPRPRAATTARSSRPRARRSRSWPCVPEAALEPASPRAPPGRRSCATPSFASRSSIFGPTPQSRRTGSGRQERGLGARRHHHQAVGLAHVRGDLGHQLAEATPTEAVSEVSRRIALLQVARRWSRRCRSARRLPVTSRNASSIETRLHEVGEAAQDLHHLRARRARTSPCPTGR